jgi:iron complex outermembrane recepter protein
MSRNPSSPPRVKPSLSIWLPGNYQVRVAAPGFSQLSRDFALTGADPYQPVNFALALGTAQNTVTVSANGGFVGSDAATGTKTDTALVEVPQSVSVITLAELQDRNVQTLDQALQYTPGVSPSVYGQDDRFDWITIRGSQRRVTVSFATGFVGRAAIQPAAPSLSISRRSMS